MTERVLGALRVWTRLTVALFGANVLACFAYFALCESTLSRSHDEMSADGASATWNGAARVLTDLARIHDLGNWVLVLAIASFLAFVIWSQTALAAGIVFERRGIKLATLREMYFSLLCPIVNLVLPFRYLRELLRACDPSDLAPVSVRVLPPRGYRVRGVETVDAWKPPTIPFAACWALFVLSEIGWGASMIIAADERLADTPTTIHLEAARALVAMASAIAFILLARGTGELIVERARRLAAIKPA